jgi:DNA-binding MarR family transcriptional regulator
MAKVRWLSPIEHSAWLGYRRMRSLLDLQIARDLEADSGLSESDYDVLTTLSGNRTHQNRANELASRLRWSTSRLAHHVGRMEQRGLVSRETCDDDGRGATVVMTERGWTVLKGAAPFHVESVRAHFIDLLTPTEVEALTQITAKVIEHLASVDQTVPGTSTRSPRKSQLKIEAAFLAPK